MRAIARFRAGYGRVLEWVVIALVVIARRRSDARRRVPRARPLARVVRRGRVGAARLAHVLRRGARVGQARAHRLPRARRRHAVARRGARSTSRPSCVVIAFFALLGAVGAWILPVLHTDALVSLPWIPISVVQSVIPISRGADHRRRDHASRRPHRGERAARRLALPAACTDRGAAAMTTMLLLFGCVLALVLVNVPIAVSLGIVAARRDGGEPRHRHPAEPRARHLQRRDQLPAAGDPAVHPRRRDHERVGHLAPADRVRVGAVRLDPRRPRARVDRRVDVLRRDLRARRSPTSPRWARS